MLVPTPLRHWPIFDPGEQREEDFPTTSQEPEAHARVPQEDAHPGWTRGAAPAPPQGAQAAHGDRIEEVTRVTDERPRARLPRAARLTRRPDFLAVQQRGRRVSGTRYLLF